MRPTAEPALAAALVAAARANGVPVEYVVFEDAGHGFLKKANKRRAYEGIRAFLDRHLKGSDGPPATAG